MKNTFIALIAAAALWVAGGAGHAAVPAGWDNVQASTSVMGLVGSVTIDGVPVRTDNASVLAVFAPGVANPVGVYTFAADSGVDNTGRYGILAVYGADGTVAGAADNALLTFAFYNARTGAVLYAPVVRNQGIVFPAATPLPYADNTTVRFVPGSPMSVIDNVSLAFVTPVSNVNEGNWVEKTFNCSAAGGRGPGAAEGALTLLIMLAPAIWMRQAARRKRREGGAC